MPKLSIAGKILQVSPAQKEHQLNKERKYLKPLDDLFSTMDSDEGQERLGKLILSLREFLWEEVE